MSNNVEIQISVKGLPSLSFGDFNNTARRQQVTAALRAEFAQVAAILDDCGVTDRQIIDVAQCMGATIEESNIARLKQKLDPTKFDVRKTPPIENTLDMMG